MIHGTNSSVISQDDNDSGFNSDEEAVISGTKKRTKAQRIYKKSNAAVLPDFISIEAREPDDCPTKETTVWSSSNKLDKHQIRQFIFEAKTETGFSTEQTLALLHSNKYDVAKARNDLKVFAPLPSLWPEDRTTFISAFRVEDKYFYGIKDKFFPSRSVADMVEYYYTWKMEKKRKKFKAELKKARFLKVNKTCSERRGLETLCENKN